MRSVHQPANIADAHLVKQLLEAEGIPAHVSGEYLQGAVGELPVGTPIDVSVADGDAARARAIVEDWERAAPDPADFGDADDDDGDAAPAYARGPARGGPSVFAAIMLFLCGALAGGALAWSALRGPERAEDVDYDGDGRADERVVYSGPTLLRTEADRDGDRRVDRLTDFGGPGGTAAFTDVDEDFDGRMESRERYERGLAAHYGTDFDGDGDWDYEHTYRAGVIDEAVWRDARGAVVKRMFHASGWPARDEIDTDGDGRLDTARRYDARGEIVSRAPIAAR